MKNNPNPPLDEIDFIEDDIHKIQKKAHVRKIEKRKIKVRSTIQIARDTYHEARSEHNKAIWTAWLSYRGQIWRAWRAYRNTRKQHKILKHQAKNIYRLAKLQEKIGK